MMKIGTIKHNSDETRIGLYYKNNSIYTKEGVVNALEGWITLENYVQACNGVWGAVWDLRFEELQLDIRR